MNYPVGHEHITDDQVSPLENLLRKYGGWTNRMNRYRALGLNIDRIGEMSVEKVIDGVTWIVRPQNAKPEFKVYRNVRHCSHRLLVECPECKKIVSFGRIHQHAKVHSHQQY